MPHRVMTLLLLLPMVFGLAIGTASDADAATRTQHVSRAAFEAELSPGTISTDGFEVSDGYPTGFAILDATTMNAAFGETEYASTFFNPPDWNFILSGSDQRYCAGCNGSFRLSFQSATETCTGAVRDGVYGVGFDIESHSFSQSPAGPYSAFVTYGDGTTENFNFPAGASFFGITSPDLIAEIHVAINNVPTGSGSIVIDNMTLGNAPGGCPTSCESMLLYDNNSSFQTAQAAAANAGFSPTVADSSDFVSLLTGQSWDVVLLDNPSSEPSGAWQNELANYIAGGGRAIHTHWNSGSLTTQLQDAFDIDAGGTHNTLTFYRWNSHPLFSSPNAVPDIFDVWSDVWGSNGFFLDIEPSSGGVSAAGFTPTPQAMESAIVIGNGGRTIFNGFLFDDYNPADKDTDGTRDIVELIENEIATVCGGAAPPPTGDNEADLSIAKSASPSPAVAGEQLTYTVTATNEGPDEASNGIGVTDELPSAARFVSAVASDAGTCSTPSAGSLGGTVDCEWTDPVAVGDTRTVTITVDVCPDAGCGNSLTNDASARLLPGEGGGGGLVLYGATSIQGGGGGEGVAAATATDLRVIQGEIPRTIRGDVGANLDRSADVGAASITAVQQGLSVLYEIDPATGATTMIGDIGFPAVSGLAVLGDGRLVASSGASGPAADLIEVDRNTGAGTLIGRIGEFGSQSCGRFPDLTWDGATSTLYGYGDFCSGDPEGLFTIDTTTGDGTSVGASGYTGGGNGLAWDPGTDTLYGTPFDQSSLVTFDKSTGAGTDVPGSAGNVPFRVNSLDVHPTTGDLYGIWNDSSSDWWLVTLDKNTGVHTVIGNTDTNRMDALVFDQQEGGLVDPDPSNNSTELVTPVDAEADLSVSKSDSPDPVIAGNALTYELTVDNAGPSTAQSVTLVDELDDNVSFVSATVSPSGPVCSHSGGTVTCELGAIGTGQECFGSLPGSYTVSIEVMVSELTPCSPNQCPGSEQFGAEPLENVATVSHTDECTTDPDTSDNSDTELTDVLAGADVLIDPPTVMRVGAGGGGAPSSVPGDASLDAEVPLQDGEEACLASGDFLMLTQTFSNTGPDAFTTQRNNEGPEYEMELPAQVVGTGDCRVISGGGSCTATSTNVRWDGEMAVGEGVELMFQVRIRGGLPLGTPISFVGEVFYDEFNVSVNSATRSAASEELALTCEPIVNPNGQLGTQVHLPILNFQGQDDVCETWIEVQNIGCANVKAALITWGEPGFCPPQSAGPLKVECTGLLKPGSTWNLLGAQVPTGSKSGILFQFSAAQLSDIGQDDDVGFDDIVGDYLCETLFFGVVGDSDDYRRFKKAYDEGLEFALVTLDERAKGDGALAADVHRTCPGDTTPGVEVTSKYNGIAGTHLGVFDEVFGGYGFYVPLVYADASGFNSILYIQNGGLQCSSLEVWFQEQESCLRATICDVTTLAPGESYQLDANDCVGPDFQGSAWIRSSQVMGIAVDIIGRDVLMTYVAEPAEINYTFDPTEATFTAGNQVAFGPLIYSEYQGWDSGVQVQNLSAVTAAKVKVYFLDRSGDVITTLVDWVCPRGSQTFFLPVIFDLPGNWVGSVRVESQEWLSPGNPPVAPANIVGIATLLKYDDAARTNTIEAIAYNLLPEHKIYDWQIASGTGGDFEAGVGLVAIPSLIRDLGGTGVTSELAIANVVPKPGFTDLAIYIYDQNGLLDYLCQKLNEKQVEYIDVATWGFINPGFKGSAVLSAFFWEHEVFDQTGFFLRNLVGLGAVAVERKGRASYEIDVPGDEAAGARGIPFMTTFDEDGEPTFEFCFMGYPPLCAGLPDLRPDPLECPESLVAECENCPQAIPQAGAMQTALAEVDLSASCQIEDVDMTLDLNHTWTGDLDVDLTSPEGTESRLFSGICGANDDIMVILDDQASQPIGSVCPAVGFNEYTTQSGDALTEFNGEDPAGTWSLDIFDNVGGDSGELNSFSLDFDLAP